MELNCSADATTESFSISSSTHFGFAFDNPTYSDRVLRLVFNTQQLSDAKTDNLGDDAVSPQTGRSAKRRRCEDAAPIEGVGEGEEAVEVHVNSMLLAKSSYYFRRIFDGENFRESSEKVIDIHLKPEEKEPFMDILQYTYSNSMLASTASGLVSVWILAQRFLFQSCADVCMQKMEQIPATLEQASYFLDLASVVDQCGSAKDLIGRSCAFLVEYFPCITVLNGENPGRWENVEDLATLPSSPLEYLLSSDKLQVVHEESVFHLLRLWVGSNCTSSEEEKQAWEKFCPLVRWPLIEVSRLRALLNTTEAQYIKEFLLEAFAFKASNEEARKIMDVSPRFRRRELHAIPVTSFTLESPVQQATVYFNLEWNTLILKQTPGPLYSERFVVGCHCFIWLVQFQTIEKRKQLNVGLVCMTNPSGRLRISIKIGVWSSTRHSFSERYTGTHILSEETSDRIAMCSDCFGRQIDEIQLKMDFWHLHKIWFRCEVQIAE